MTMARTCRPGRPGEEAARLGRDWDDRLVRFVRDHGGTAALSGYSSSSGQPFHECRLDTTLGSLSVCWADTWLACRFAEPERARQSVACNPHSGKWNFHGTSQEESFAAFTREVSRLLIGINSQGESLAALRHEDLTDDP
jgi:hypothetical protein